MLVHCFSLSIASSGFFLPVKKQNSSMVYGEPADRASIQTSETAPRSGIVSPTTAIDLEARPMALPVLRFDHEAGGPPNKIPSTVGR